MACALDSQSKLTTESIVSDNNSRNGEQLGLLGKRTFLYNKTDGESSQDSLSSLSNYMQVGSDSYSDSDFEEHPYSAKKKILLKTKLLTGYSKINSMDNDRKEISTCRKQSKKSKCISKNALMARINREKKKKYIEGLETKNAELEREITILKDNLNKHIEEVASLKRQANNLQNVIRNSTEIGSLLKCIHQNTDLQISSSLIKDVSQQSQNTTLLNKQTITTLNETTGSEKGKHIIDLIEHYNFVESPKFSPETFITNHDIYNDFMSDLDQSQHMLFESENNIGFKSEIINSATLDSEPVIAVDEMLDLRCETPSRGYEPSVNEGCLFDDTGICFHISNRKVSLEFCDTCNQMAKVIFGCSSCERDGVAQSANPTSRCRQ